MQGPVRRQRSRARGEGCQADSGGSASFFLAFTAPSLLLLLTMSFASLAGSVPYPGQPHFRRLGRQVIRLIIASCSLTSLRPRSRRSPSGLLYRSLLSSRTLRSCLSPFAFRHIILSPVLFSPPLATAILLLPPSHVNSEITMINLQLSPPAHFASHRQSVCAKRTEHSIRSRDTRRLPSTSLAGPCPTPALLPTATASAAATRTQTLLPRPPRPLQPRRTTRRPWSA